MGWESNDVIMDTNYKHLKWLITFFKARSTSLNVYMKVPQERRPSLTSIHNQSSSNQEQIQVEGDNNEEKVEEQLDDENEV